MAEQVGLAARARAGSGKGESRKLRRQGRVPAVAYGVGLESTSISVDALELYHVLHGHAGDNAVVRLGIAETTHLALVREIYRHPVRREVMHVDFVTVSRTERVHVEIPIQLEGEPSGVASRGVAEQALFTVNVQVLPLEVPDQISLDISGMQLGDALRIADLQVPAGVEVLDDDEMTIVSLVVPHADLPEEQADEQAETADQEAGVETGDDAAS